MPKNALGGDGDFGRQIGARERHAFGREAAQRDAPNDPIFFRNSLGIEKAPERVRFRIRRDGRGQTDAKALRARLAGCLSRRAPKSPVPDGGRGPPA